ncbi:MAG: hypothetical protein JJT85_00230 [Chromatiales bacterium]|nr:hypothetical protein [Chromatiales bacterium]
MSLVEQILDLTARVEACLESGDWGTASALEQERQGLLARYCDGERIRALGEQERNLLRALLERNRSAISRLEQARADLGATASLLTRGQGAIRAYARNGPGSPLMETPETGEWP